MEYLTFDIATEIPNKRIRQMLINKLERNGLTICFQSNFWYFEKGSLGKATIKYLAKLWQKEYISL